MFRFEHIDFLWGLILIPVLIIAYALRNRWRKKILNKLGDAEVVQQLLPPISKSKRNTKIVLYCFAFISLIIGLANPQYGTKLEEVKREGIDLMIALDVSNSMLAEDLSPNRLQRAKRSIEQLLNRLHSDRIGIIIFAGQAYTQLPITTDYGAARLFLETINTDMVPTQGTAIGAAIELALESYNFESPTSKALIIITDGENHEDNATEQAQKAAELGVVVHTIGMGSTKGTPIPVYQKGVQIGYREDQEGNTVVTKLNEPMLQEIAATGNGIYVRATNANAGLDIILDEINALEKTEYGAKMYTDYEGRFQLFIAFALFLLILELLLSERKSKWLNTDKLFKE